MGIGTWLLTIFVLAATASEGAKLSDVTALKAAATELGIPAQLWNFSTDPCTGNWIGVGCCFSNSNSSCCSDPGSLYNDVGAIHSCDDGDGEISLLLLRSDVLNLTLAGKLSESLCNLSSLLVLDVGLNNLSGSIPTCLQKLSSLKVLRLGGNRLSGTIPSQLGQLSALQQLYLDTLQLEGEIPRELGSLSNLTNLVLRTNKLNGSIPVEIGNLSNLLDLELQVNSLTGSLPQLPQSLKTLTLFNNLLTGELQNSTFPKSLETINLRRNAFSGQIPNLSLIYLTQLDLGFNRFAGRVPSLGESIRLESLFIGHNDLDGSIPKGLPTTLNYLDLSHNRLSGSLSSLTSMSPTIQVDIAFNSFDAATAPTTLASAWQQFNCPTSANPNPSGCPQSGNRLYFAAHAGGEIKDAAFIRFDPDAAAATPSNSSLGMFSSSEAWSMEISGQSAGIYAGKEAQLRSSGSLNETEIALCSTMRWSSSYIAYHGIRLRPGNYVVSMYFAETVFDQPGYRTFDVVVGGTVVKKALDVVSEAGGPNTAYKLTTQTVVTENGTVSVELISAGPDRYLLPGRFAVESTGPMVSAVSVVSVDYHPSSSSNSSGRTTGIVVGSVIGALGLLALVISSCCLWQRKTKTKKGESMGNYQEQPLVAASGSMNIEGVIVFTYDELEQATGGFVDKLGTGGFGAVYKGVLPNGTVVAVKQLISKQQNDKENSTMKEDFRKEIMLLAKVRHRNLLSVIGYCLDPDMPMLITEFMHNGSLDKWLWTSSSSLLTWEARRKIAIGIARGLAYLHDESTKYRIIHCDVKPANILLDAELNPRIGDFGLARLYENDASHVTATRVKGTAGYLAPEYAMHLQLSDKVDVYSFGIVLLELLSGRKAVDFAAPSEQCVLVDYAHKKAADVPGAFAGGLIDIRLGQDVDAKQAMDFASIAILCTQRQPSLRPKMRNVWLMLNGTIQVPEYIASALDCSFELMVGGSSSYSTL